MRLGQLRQVNDAIIPREVGQDHTRYFAQVAPAPATLYEYWILPVDVNREPAYPCCGFCSSCNAFASCPESSAPVAVGTLEDWGWAIFVNSCAGSCYPSGYIYQEPIMDELRPYVGTSTAFRFFGAIGCGSVEGCSLRIDRWEFATCVTPVVTRTWGQLKTIYR